MDISDDMSVAGTWLGSHALSSFNKPAVRKIDMIAPLERDWISLFAGRSQGAQHEHAGRLRRIQHSLC